MSTTIEKLQQALAKAKGRRRVDLLVELADHQGRGGIDAAGDSLQEALDLASELGYRPGEIDARIELGLGTVGESDLDAAERELSRALELARAEADPARIVRALNGIGNVHNLRGDFLQALNTFVEALHLVEQSDGVIDGDRTLNHLAHVHSRLGDLERSLHYHQRFAESAEASGDPLRIATAYNNTGVLQRENGDYTGALRALRKSLPPARRSGSKRTLSRSLTNIGLTFMRMNRSRRAIRFCELALHVNQGIDNPMGDLDALRTQGAALARLEELERAAEVLEHARAIAEEHQLPMELKGCYGQLAEIYRALGRFEQAYEHLDKMHDLSEELFDAEKARLFSEAETRHKSEIYQLKNVKLAAANIEISKQRALLERARDEAQAADRAKSEFLAVMSHEVRTPLNGVIGMADLLKATGLSGDQNEYVETIRMSGEALLSVLNDILDFSKSEAGKMRIESAEFDLVSSLRDLVATLEPSAARRDLKLVCRLAPNLPPAVRGDWKRIRQILLNLLDNAMKFTRAGRIDLEVTTVEEESDACHVSFTIKDTGIGISDEIQRRIFEPFVQADSSTTREFGGTGLGLVICRRLVEIMGGSIGVESELGSGSSFWFTIRLHPHGGDRETAAPRGADLEGLRALVVEEHPAQQVVAAHMLSGWGMRVQCVADATEALDEIGKALDAGEPYALALIDRRLPGTSGLELGRLLRADRTADLPLILMSAVVRKDDAERARESGFGAYLAKPLAAARVLAALRDVRRPCPERLQEQHAAPRAAVRATGAGRPAHAPDILLVEDNEINRLVSTRMIEALGCRVAVAHDGAEAVASVARGHFDLVLMDCQMPVVDGYTATRRIRALPGDRGRVPIVAMTAHALAGDRDKCLSAGMDDYLAKPFTSDQVGAALRKWLGPGDQGPRKR